MGKGLAIRGLNAGDAARVLKKKNEHKDCKDTAGAIHQRTLRATEKTRREQCFQIQLPCNNASGDTFQMVCMDLHALFGSMAAVSEGFGEVLWNTIQGYEVPVILYADEITPGNPLQPDPARKCWMFYAAPACGAPTRNEQTWGLFCTIRVQIVKQITGGLATVWRSLIRNLLERNVPKLLQVSLLSFANEGGLGAGSVFNDWFWEWAPISVLQRAAEGPKHFLFLNSRQKKNN